MANPDFLGRNQQGIETNKTVNGRFYNVQIASASVEATIKLPDGTKLIDNKPLQVGETFTLREGYSEVTKHSGNGVIVLDSTN